jgi:hypothetical protein
MTMSNWVVGNFLSLAAFYGVVRVLLWWHGI